MLLVIVATILGVFFLPYLFPPHIPCVSVSYLAGYSNRVAVILAALISLASIGYFYLHSTSATSRYIERDPQKDLPLWMLAIGCVFCVAWTSLLAFLVVKHHVNYWDPSYFIDRMRMSVEFGKHPYTELEFPYGPILFYLPILTYRLLHPMGLSIVASYYACHITLATVGVGLVFYLVNQLPFSERWKRVAFFILVFQAPNFIMGINYTYLRFAIPFAFFLAVVKQSSSVQRMIGSAVATFLALGVSPEMGIALSAGFVAYAGVTYWRKGRQFLVLIPATLTGFALFLLIFGRGPLSTLGQFSIGIFNFVVQPLPYILVFLTAVVWLSPQTVAWSLSDQDGDLRVPALYIMAMALLPAALGRSDPMHVIYNGFGFFVLSILTIQFKSRVVQTAWIAALVLAGLITHAVTAHDYKLMLLAFDSRHSKIFLAEDHPPEWLANPSQHLDTNSLRSIVGDKKVYTPVMLATTVEDQLRSEGFSAGSYYFNMVGVWDEKAEKRKLAEMNQFSFALLPKGRIEYWETPETQSVILGKGFHSKIRQPIFRAGALISADLADHWEPRATFGPYVLYERKA